MRIKERVKSFLKSCFFESCFFNRRRIIGLCAAGFAVLFGVLSEYANYMLHYVCIGICIAFIITAINLIFLTPSIRKVILNVLEEMLLRFTKRILNIAEKIVTVIAEAIRKIINKIKEKFSFGTNGAYKGRRMAKDYVDIKERVGVNARKNSKKRKKKYKDMDNIERIRFLYEKKVTGAIKSGVKVEESMTPNEAGGMMIEYRHMKSEGMELIDKYNFARYDDEVVITDEMVERVRKL